MPYLHLILPRVSSVDLRLLIINKAPVFTARELTLPRYGHSTGRPSEKGLMIDAQTALNHLLTNPSTAGTSIFIYGQSLGGALAIQLVAKNQDKVAGLILENTFRSIRTLIPTVFPPARYLARLCHQIWPSEATLPAIKGVPVLFLSGLKDELVPYVSAW